MGKKSIPFPLSDEGAPFATDEILAFARDNKINVTSNHIDLANKIMLFLEKSFGFSRHEICKPGREGAYIPAKITFSYFMLTRSDAAERLIGCFLGGRDHSTIINMLKAYEHYWIDDEMKECSDFRDRVMDLRNRLRMFTRRVRRIKNLAVLVDLEDRYCGSCLKAENLGLEIPNILSVPVPDVRRILNDFMLFQGYAKNPNQMEKVNNYIDVKKSS